MLSIIWTMILWTVDDNDFIIVVNGSEMGVNTLITALRSLKVPVNPGGPYLSTTIFEMQRLRKKKTFKVKRLWTQGKKASPD